MQAKLAKSALKEIATIRGIQRLAAEAQAAGTSRTLQTKSALLEKSKHERSSAEGDWSRVVSTPSLELEILRLWSLDLLRRNEAVARVSSEVEQTAQELSRRVADWSAAVNRHDVATDLVQQALKAEAGRRDEIALQDALDRHAHSRRDY